MLVFFDVISLFGLVFVTCLFQISVAIILMGKRELVALPSLSFWCLVIVVWLFLAMPWACLQFVIVVFPDHTHLLFLRDKSYGSINRSFHFLLHLAQRLSFSAVPKTVVSCFWLNQDSSEVSKGTKIRNRYNQVPHLTQGTKSADSFL